VKNSKIFKHANLQKKLIEIIRVPNQKICLAQNPQKYRNKTLRIERFFTRNYQKINLPIQKQREKLIKSNLKQFRKQKIH
jgi:hypothetical protein